MMATTIENLFESNWGIFNAKFQIQISIEKLTSKSQKFPNLVAHHWLPTLGVAFGEELLQKKSQQNLEKKTGFSKWSWILLMIFVS